MAYLRQNEERPIDNAAHTVRQLLIGDKSIADNAAEVLQKSHVINLAKIHQDKAYEIQLRANLQHKTPPRLLLLRFNNLSIFY